MLEVYLVTGGRTAKNQQNKVCYVTITKAKVGHSTSKAQINCGVWYVCDISKQENKKYINKLEKKINVKSF